MRTTASVELYWLPLGAGGWFVRLNGRIWEAVHARLEHRRPLELYHTALVVRVPEGRFVVENCWPIPNADGPARGVLVEGPVFSHRLGRWRVFRYEVRCWPDGTIADAGEAVASPQPLSDDPLVARRLLELVGCLPNPVWGRDEHSPICSTASPALRGLSGNVGGAYGGSVGSLARSRRRAQAASWGCWA
jgi:hypothetical protein